MDEVCDKNDNSAGLFMNGTPKRWPNIVEPSDFHAKDNNNIDKATFNVDHPVYHSLPATPTVYDEPPIDRPLLATRISVTLVREQPNGGDMDFDLNASPLSTNRSVDSSPSTDNLSYSSELGLIGDVIPLPSNFLSEDEVSSNSDDCVVYAYRGEDTAPVVGPIPPGNDEEEETDFLEMDFDPDPASEIENYGAAGGTTDPPNDDDIRIPREISKIAEVVQINSARTHETEQRIEQEKRDQRNGTDMEPTVVATPQPERYTGAKPKILTNKSIDRPVDESPCLDCVKNRSVCQQCQLVQMNIRPSVVRLNRIDSLLQQNDRSFGESEQKRSKCSPDDNEQPSTSRATIQIKPKRSVNQFKSIDVPMNSVTIHSTDCLLETVQDALIKLNLTVNVDPLKRYFDKRTLDPDGLSVPEYILKQSKRYSDYKELIRAIRSACEETIRIEFCPLDSLMTTPETVRIKCLDIVERWTCDTDLRPIIKIRNKRFRKMNILGKLANIIRQYAPNKVTNRTVDDDSYIEIPQYYKSGYICVSRGVN